MDIFLPGGISASRKLLGSTLTSSVRHTRSTGRSGSGGEVFVSVILEA